MSRASLALVALFTISFMSFFGYSCATRTHTAGPELAGESPAASRPELAADASSPAADAALPSQPFAAGTEQTSPVTNSEASSSPTVPPGTLARWIAEATGDDPKARAAAIVALAEAPRSEALPVLQRVLNTGEPEVDRPLALRSLRTLALHQGDTDGVIRNVLRQAIYHGDNEAVTQGAQAVLDDVEGASGQIAPNASP